jgi:hypothetical protein
MEDPRLQSLQDHAVRVFYLPIRVGVRHDGPVDADVVVIAKFEEFLPCELYAVIFDDGVRNTKAVDDIEERFHGLLGSDRRDRPSLNSLRKLVNGDKEMRVAPGAFLRRPTRSSPQTVNGHVMGIVWSACTGRWVCRA